MKKNIYKVLTLLCCCFSALLMAQEQNYLSVSGNKLIDSRGKEVRLTGVNWFGFETQNFFPHGIWTRDMKSVLQQIKDLGFNTIRLPWCNEMLNPETTITIPSYGSDAYTGISPMNEVETNITKPIDLLDVFVQWCQDNNMKIVLDNHSRASDAFLDEDYWYTDEYSEERWINDWIFLAERYKDYSAVVGMDLNNEPHGSTWGNSNPATDWNKAAERCGNAILEVNPNVLIIVEGVGEFEGNSYWWGGQLMGARKYPVQLSDQSKLVYSAHEYGPEVSAQDWFNEPNFPENMSSIWNDNFGYLYEENMSPLFVGEFGIKDQDAFNGISYTWFTELMQFMGSRYSWTFWCMNPNSGDTGGILQDDWATVNQWKLDVLKPYFEPEIPNVIGGIGDENQLPIAQFTNEAVVGDTLTLAFDASDSSDPDGDSLTYSWDFGDGNTATGLQVTHTFIGEGEYTVVLTVNDGEAQVSTSKSIMVTQGEEPGGCAFGAPLATPLATINATYNHIFTFGNAPDLSNVVDFTINWNLANNGLYQFSMNTSNGQPSWWNDFIPKITQNFNQVNPGITIANSGFPGLDGSYWVSIHNDNFVLVSKSQEFTIYFSTSAQTPICENSVATNPIALTVSPNPVLNELLVESDESLKNTTVKIANYSGVIISEQEITDDAKSKVFELSKLESGMYFIHLQKGNQTIIKKIIKRF